MRSKEFPFSSESFGYFLVENIQDYNEPIHVIMKNHKNARGSFYRDIIDILD
jgi:hypothetical protein